jgi:hypothetical protein
LVFDMTARIVAYTGKTRQAKHGRARSRRIPLPLRSDQVRIFSPRSRGGYDPDLYSAKVVAPIPHAAALMVTVTLQHNG